MRYPMPFATRRQTRYAAFSMRQTPHLLVAAAALLGAALITASAGAQKAPAQKPRTDSTTGSTAKTRPKAPSGKFGAKETQCDPGPPITCKETIDVVAPRDPPGPPDAPQNPDVLQPPTGAVSAGGSGRARNTLGDAKQVARDVAKFDAKNDEAQKARDKAAKKHGDDRLKLATGVLKPPTLTACSQGVLDRIARAIDATPGESRDPSSAFTATDREALRSWIDYMGRPGPVGGAEPSPVPVTRAMNDLDMGTQWVVFRLASNAGNNLVPGVAGCPAPGGMSVGEGALWSVFSGAFAP